MHVRAARRNGLSDDEIKEVLLQSAIYCGVPAANSAFAVASRVFAEDSGEERPKCNSSDESCWSRNRRAHFLVTGRTNVG